MKSTAVVFLLLVALQAAAGSPRRFIVEWTQSARAGDELESLREQTRVRVTNELSRVLHGAVIELGEGVPIDDIARLPYVARITPDAEVTAYGDGAVESAHDPLRAAITPRHAAPNATGSGIVVAVVDSGIDRFHPALAGKVIGGYDFVNDDDDPMDDHRHGTHVAGIIAASGSTMSGIAPGVRLLAYKVLDSAGKGTTSSVLAGLERAVDPNGDGNLSDRADVINLSLGSPGHPGDPLSRAVENAVAAGSVVVAAAGNAGEFHTIGSPGVAHSAITVGATDAMALVAEFSSRGPAVRSGAIKPDLLAPGAAILSSVPGGQYARISGTSMAAPYVSGIAALIREAHPDWSPERVKAALVNTAVPLAGEEAMSQGSGQVDRVRALASEVAMIPTQANFGLDGSVEARWTSSRTIVVRNDATSTRTVELTAEGPVAVRITPSTLTLQAGGEAEVRLSIDVEHAVLGKPLTGSLAFSGSIVAHWEGGDARVPWAFLRAGRMTVTHPAARPDVLLNIAGRYASFAPEANGVEALLEPGSYDLLAVTDASGDVRVFVAEEQRVEGEVMFGLTDAASPHEILLDGVDERGLPLTATASRVRMLLPGYSVVLPRIAGRSLHASSFSERYAVLAIESAFDAATNSIRIVQHPPLRGLSADAVLRNHPLDYRRQEVRLRFQDVGTRTVTLMPRDWPLRPEEFGPSPQTFTDTSESNTWDAIVYATQEHDLDVVGGLQISAGIGGQPHLASPMIRRDAQGFFTTRSFDRPHASAVADGDLLELGGTLLHAAGSVAASGSGVGGTMDIRGSRGESRRDLTPRFRVVDGNDAQVAQGEVQAGTFFAPLPSPGRYRVEVTAGGASMTAGIDTSAGQADVPMLTALAVLDHAGRHTSHLRLGGNGALVFSSSDRTPHVFFRRRGRATWVQLTPVQVAEDEEYGFTHRVDLADALRFEGEVEIGLELTGDDGSTMTWIVPAFTSEPEPSRRRAARH